MRASHTLTDDDIIDIMLRRGTTIGKSDALAAIALYQETIINALAQGNNVTTGLANFSVSIRGAFAGHDAPFNRAEHTLHAIVQSGKTLQRAIAAADAERVEAYSLSRQIFKPVRSTPCPAI